MPLPAPGWNTAAMALDKMLAPIGWIGPANASIPDKLRFLESAFLHGFQMAQRSAGIDHTSADFVVDAGLNLTKRGNEILGWYIRTKDGRTSYLEHKPVRRRKKKRIKTAASSPLFQSAKAGT